MGRRSSDVEPLRRGVEVVDIRVDDGTDSVGDGGDSRTQYARARASKPRIGKIGLFRLREGMLREEASCEGVTFGVL